MDYLQTELDFLCGIITGDETWIFYMTQKPAPDIVKAKESETVKIESQSHFDLVLWCEEHQPLQVLTTVPENQSVVYKKIM